jgi:hypothetical protein
MSDAHSSVAMRWLCVYRVSSKSNHHKHIADKRLKSAAIELSATSDSVGADDYDDDVAEEYDLTSELLIGSASRHSTADSDQPIRLKRKWTSSTSANGNRKPAVASSPNANHVEQVLGVELMNKLRSQGVNL